MIDNIYGRFANLVSDFIGSVWSLAILLAFILISGTLLDFSHRWESLLHLAMAFLALVAVFFLQRSQRHGDKAINLKLDELIRAVEGARSHLAKVETKPEHVIERIADRS